MNCRERFTCCFSIVCKFPNHIFYTPNECSPEMAPFELILASAKQPIINLLCAMNHLILLSRCKFGDNNIIINIPCEGISDRLAVTSRRKTQYFGPFPLNSIVFNNCLLSHFISTKDINSTMILTC